MNRPRIRTSFETPVGHHQIPSAGHPPSATPIYPPQYESTSPGRSAQPHDGSRRTYEQLPPVHGLQQRESHLHLPAVSTYIEHYHYYNFNGNCTVQQASSDGGPNTIRMVGTPVHQGDHLPRPQGDPLPPRRAPHVEVPPVPPPIREPLPRGRNVGPAYPYAAEPRVPLDQDKRPGASAPASYASLPMTHLPPIPGSTRSGLMGPSSSPLARQSPFMSAARLGQPPSSGPESRMMPGAQSSLLPRLRGSFDPGGPISLAPLQSSGIPPLRADETKLDVGRPTKRSRVSRSLEMPLSGQNIGGNQPGRLPGAGTEGNDPSEDHRTGQVRSGAGPSTRFGLEPVGRNANSSSPSHGDYPMPSGRGDGFDRNGSGIPRAGPRTRTADETQVNDWEAVVDMYNTGRGTEDGVALRLITKGDGRRVSDRKLLEKRRTIGKTHEILGAERFEAAIGYKWENGARRKQKMYHVISRCRVVNAMRKSNEPIPTDHAQLTSMIDERITQKEALKEAGKSGAAPGGGGAGAGAGGNRGGEIGYGTGAGPTNPGGGGGAGLGGLGGNGNNNRSGPEDVVEDEIERGGLHERGRYG